MSLPELFFGVSLVLALVGLAGFFAWRQLRTRQGLSLDLPSDERGFVIRQTRRRVLCSVLMVLFAGFLVGWYFIEPRLEHLRPLGNEDPRDKPPVVELVAYYWIAALLVLFGIIAVAGLDFFATARYALKQKKLLKTERRVALEIEAARMRKRRNGS